MDELGWRGAANGDSGTDVVIFLDRTEMLDSLQSGLQVYQLLGSSTETDPYHAGMFYSCRKLHDQAN